MRFTYLRIQNFKSIRDMEIQDIGQALILVGKNNTGKTSILDAVSALCGSYTFQERDFNRLRQAVRMTADPADSGTGFYGCGGYPGAYGADPDVSAGT